MLLHPQDRAYSVPEIMEFVEAAGLIFFGWNDKRRLLRRPVSLRRNAGKGAGASPPWSNGPIVENLALLNARHDFFVREPQTCTSTSLRYRDYLS